MFAFLVKKCFLCDAKIEKHTGIQLTVPVRGYIEDQKRHFCSEAHAEFYDNRMREIMKNHVPGCRTCYS